MNWQSLPIDLFWRASGIILVVYTLLYILKIREQRIPVTQWFLWEKVIRSGETSLLARFLRRFFSFLIQVMVAFLVLTALRNSKAPGEKKSGNSIVILVDLSASIGAKDIIPSRWEWIQRELIERIKGLSLNDEAALVVYGSSPRIEVSWTKDFNKIINKIEELDVTDEPSDHGKALRFAKTLLIGKRHPQINWVTDGQGRVKGVIMPPVPKDCKDTTGMPLTGIDIKVLFPPIKVKNNPNWMDHGFTSFAVRPRLNDQDTGDAYMRIERFFGKGRAYVDIYVDGNWRTRLEVKEKIFEKIFPIPLGGSHITARLSPGGGIDLLESNDEIFAASPPMSEPRIVLVGDENFFLEAALLLTGGYLKKISKEEYSPNVFKDCGGDKCNIAVFNEFAPSSVPNVPNQLYIHPPKGGPFKVAKTFKQNLQILWTGGKKAHPIMKGVRMEDINLWGQWYAFKLQRFDRPLMQIDEMGTVVSLLRHNRGKRLVALGFSLKESDFVLFPYFPIWILNTISWFTGASSAMIVSVPTGTLVDIQKNVDTLKTPVGIIKKKLQTFVPMWRGFYKGYWSENEIFSVGAALLNREEEIWLRQEPKISCNSLIKWEKSAKIKAQKASIPWIKILMIFFGALGLLFMSKTRGALGAGLAFLGLSFLGFGVIGLLLLSGMPIWVSLLGGAAVISWFEWLTYHRRVTV